MSLDFSPSRSGASSSSHINKEGIQRLSWRGGGGHAGWQVAFGTKSLQPSLQFLKPPAAAAAAAAILSPTTIPYNMQCGGQGSTSVGGLPACGSVGRECRDAPWSGVTCVPGTVCVRSNNWWWFCNYGTGEVSDASMAGLAGVPYDHQLAPKCIRLRQVLR